MIDRENRFLDLIISPQTVASNNTTPPETAQTLKTHSRYCLVKLKEFAITLKDNPEPAPHKYDKELAQLIYSISNSIFQDFQIVYNSTTSTANINTNSQTEQRVKKNNKERIALINAFQKKISLPPKEEHLNFLNEFTNTATQTDLEATKQLDWKKAAKIAAIVVGVALVVLGLVAILAGLSVIPGAGPFLAALFGGSAATAAWGLFGAGVSAALIGTSTAIGAGIALRQAPKNEAAKPQPPANQQPHVPFVLDLDDLKEAAVLKFSEPKDSPKRAFVTAITSKDEFKADPEKYLENWKKKPEATNPFQAPVIHFFEEYLEAAQEKDNTTQRTPRITKHEN